jgi:hypothetical protein
MPAKALIKVDMRIAVLRELAAQGKENSQHSAEMVELLKQRGELIEKMVAERGGQIEQRAE